MRQKKVLLSALLAAGVITGVGSVSAVEVLPSCDNGAYAVLDANGNLVCQPPAENQAAPQQSAKPAAQPQQQSAQPQQQVASEQKPATQQQTAAKPVKGPIIEKRERIFTDWGPYKKKSPQELLQIIKTLLREQAPVAKYPENAPVGCCYGKLVKPPTYKEIIIKYIKEDGGYKLVINPPKFRVVEKKILVRPAYHKCEEIPAKYKIEQEKIMVAPPRAIWTYANGIYCKVQVPPEYVTITRKVLVEPPKCKKELVPPEYKIVKVKELVKDCTCEKKPVPPKYGVVKKVIQIKGPEVIWDAVLCDINLKPDDIAKIQQRLKELGYYNGPITGKLDDATMAAVVKFQVDHNLPAGNISIETLEAMGLKDLAKNYIKCEVKNLQ